MIGAVQPLMLKTKANPGGLPIDVFDGIRAGVSADRSQFFMDLTTPFYGANREGHKVTQGMRDAFWFRGMQNGLKNELDCIKAPTQPSWDAGASDSVHRASVAVSHQ